MPDSNLIDTALVAHLEGDAALSALLTDGFYWDEAPESATRFCLVSFVDESDGQAFGRRAFEDALYLVRAVIQDATDDDIAAASLRIDQLLEGATLTVVGYQTMAIFREKRLRTVERDDVNTKIRWHVRGGQYRVQMGVDA